MKTVNVMVMLQLDIMDSGDDVNEVKDAMEIINDTLGECVLNCQPQVFVENICEADIRDVIDEDDE